jgi:hypothetical protein
MKDVSFDGLSSSKFEEFCVDLLHASGFVNIDWRKGTGLATSPADKGRDIVCDHPRSEPDGSRHFERWFVDCKHFKKGVPPKELQNLLAWAEADRPDVAVFAVSNFLSNPSKEYLEAYRKNNGPPFKIRYWEKPQLVRMLRRKFTLQRKYDDRRSHQKREADIGSRKRAFHEGLVRAEQHSEERTRAQNARGHNQGDAKRAA